MVMIAPKSSKVGGQEIAFPDVCKVPAPPAPFVPIPYPNIQYQENLKKANRVDARAKAGGKKAQQNQKMAIASLKAATGFEAKSATQAVMIGKTAHSQGSSFAAVNHNGSSVNAPPGQQVSPSQTSVKVAP